METGERKLVTVVVVLILLPLLFGALTLGVRAQSDVIIVNPTALTVNEPNGSDSFNIRLVAAPTGDVTINLSTDDDTECRVRPADNPVVLTATNWEAGVDVTVNAVDDLITDGTQTCVVITDPASGDPAYAGENAADVTVSVGDNDPAGVIVSPTDFTIGEPADSRSVNFKLTGPPAANVTINLSQPPSECTRSAPSVTLTPGNWSTGVNVTVSAVDDFVIDGTKTCTVVTTNTDSIDPNYNNLGVSDITASVTDNDTAGVTVSPTNFTIAEPTGSRSVNFRLTSQPAASVTIDLSPSAQCSVSAPSVVILPADWQTGVNVTVNAVDDDIDDGDLVCNVQTSNTASGDTNYVNKIVADLTVTVTDDDTAGFTVSPTTMTVSEPFGSKRFYIYLTSQPIANVVVGVSTVSTQCSLSATSVTLTAANWSTGVNVRVTAINDDLKDGSQPCPVATGPVTGGDPKYTVLNPADVAVTVNDDDIASVSISPETVNVVEGGITDSYSLVLSSLPTADVTVSIGTDGETTVSPNQAVFNTTNWDQPRTITVTAVDDKAAEGPHTGVISHTTSSSDPNYDNLTPPDVIASIVDNDAAGFVFSPTSLTVSEPDERKAFTITLTSRPKADVTVGLTKSSDECTISPITVTLTTVNWQVGQRVEVQAVNDDLRDNDQACNVQTRPAQSTDQKYDGVDPDDVAVTVIDDDRFWSAYLPVAVRNWPPIPATPVLQPISNTNNDGDYAVAWSSADLADTYLLQEALDSAFTNPTPAYEGPDTSLSVSGKGPSRYFYRVRGQNSQAVGNWSNTQLVDVLWEKEPNDLVPSLANGPLASGPTYLGTFPSGGDINDYYYFDLASPRSVDIRLRNIPAGQNYDLVLRNSSLSSVGYSGELGAADERIQTGTLPAGRYYIQVYNRSAGGSSQAYTLQVLY